MDLAAGVYRGRRAALIEKTTIPLPRRALSPEHTSDSSRPWRTSRLPVPRLELSPSALARSDQEQFVRVVAVGHDQPELLIGEIGEENLLDGRHPRRRTDRNRR